MSCWPATAGAGRTFARDDGAQPGARTQMGRRDVRIFDSAEELTLAAAREFSRRATARVREAGTFTVALSGGSTPRSLYALLAERPPAPIPWANVQLFWGDERDVAPDHPDSNFGMVRGTL